MSQLIKQIELLMLSLLYRRGITKQLTVMLDIIAQSDNYRISSIILRSHFDKNDVISNGRSLMRIKYQITYWSIVL